MSDADLDKAIDFIAARPEIKTVLITGGDPMMDIAFLTRTLDKVSAIPHIRNIRVGTRHILFRPHHLSHDIADLLASYNRVDPENLANSKCLSIGLSLNHVDELTPDVVRAVQKFVKRGITVRGQITLLKGINDSADEMARLIEAFHLAN